MERVRSAFQVAEDFKQPAILKLLREKGKCRGNIGEDNDIMQGKSFISFSVKIQL